MHCESCGATVGPGARYCASCGHAIAAVGEAAPKRSLRERIAGLVGTSRRELLLTAATIVAIAIAIIAFIVLDAPTP